METKPKHGIAKFATPITRCVVVAQNTRTLHEDRRLYSRNSAAHTEFGLQHPLVV